MNDLLTEFRESMEAIRSVMKYMEEQGYVCSTEES